MYFRLLRDSPRISGKAAEHGAALGGGGVDALLHHFQPDSAAADHQTDALLRAGVTRENIHVDHASGAKASGRSWTWCCGSSATGTCW